MCYVGDEPDVIKIIVYSIFTMIMEDVYLAFVLHIFWSVLVLHIFWSVLVLHISFSISMEYVHWLWYNQLCMFYRDKDLHLMYQPFVTSFTHLRKPTYTNIKISKIIHIHHKNNLKMSF